MTTGAYWRWRSPIHESLDRFLVGSLSATAQPAAAAARGDHGNAPEAGHAHDHAGHTEDASLELSQQARRSLGLREGEVALTTFCRTISVPAMVIERKGRSKFTVIATMTGYLTSVFVSEGEAVSPGQPLFELRLTHEELVQAQASLLKNLQEVDIVTREIARLESIGPEGLIPRKTILERKYELQKLEAEQTAQRQALLLHGITDPQIDAILSTRTLLGTLTVRAPEAAAEITGPPSPLFVQELVVERGQHVNAGDTLAVLADHETLFIEGAAFEQD
ncbi:MAG: efflux RND transporter periplasmic adaptor subunit, partial [Planctomycetota bacterium]